MITFAALSFCFERAVSNAFSSETQQELVYSRSCWTSCGYKPVIGDAVTGFSVSHANYRCSKPLKSFTSCYQQEGLVIQFKVNFVIK